jgi:uncharacterized coiled-coil protein SlyX
LTGIAILENLGARKDSWISQKPISLGKTLAFQNCDRRFNDRENRKVVYMNQWINLKCTCALLLIPLLLVCFGLAPMAQAVGPDTDGTIPGSNNGEGIGVLVSRTVGVWNTGTGFEALNHLTAGNQNTATGLRALTSDTNGGYNTATGVFSLFSNTSGFFNSAVGAYALANNISGNSNTANGYGALYHNTADNNTSTGFGALYGNTTGSNNTANGVSALGNNTTGAQNTATGHFALVNNTASFNTAIGDSALSSNTTGSSNTAVGTSGLEFNTTGIGNIALGDGAGNGVTTADAVICIGASGANVTGSCYIGQIFGVTSSGGTAVFINSDGKLGTTTSSRRFKEEIKPMEQASEALFALKPVTFQYKKEIDPQGIPQFGLVAEDVETINPDLVVRDKDGNPFSVRYGAINAMLLNEFLKEHRKVQEQESTIAGFKSTAAEQEATVAELKITIAQQRKDFEATITELKRGMETVVARFKEQDAKIQKVTDQIELSKPAPRTVLNDH